MARVHNFCAGPAAMPDPVMQRAKDEFMNWGEQGASVMELSHRSFEFVKIARAAEQKLRRLMNIPSEYKVLFLQGGASGQFAAIPMNLLKGKSSADYVRTGIWSEKAIEQARQYCDVNIAADSKDQGYTHIPPFSDWTLDPQAAYVHYVPNETVNGVEFDWVPDTGDVPLVADMSSNILSWPIDVSRFGLIYGGAQKNIGPSGITVVIVREDLIGDAMHETPDLFKYEVQAKDGSMYNTPPTFAWYMTDLVFDWVRETGGPEFMESYNAGKAAKLYQTIDASKIYSNAVDPSCRSRMNVPFFLPDPSYDAVFLREAEEQGLLNLNGFRSVGGMRASIYNTVSEEAVDALIAFMQDFEIRHG